MSNNSVDLSGYLIVAKAGTLPVGRGSVPLVEGWITTDLPPAGGKHPFAALGDPAEAILRQAQGNAAPGLPGERLGVSVHGKLVSSSGRSFLEVRYISFFDVSNPLASHTQQADPFVANAVKLAGWLSLVEAASLRLGHSTTPMLAARLTTDRTASGGAHPVIITGSLAASVGEAFQRQARQQSAAQPASVSLPATISGRLVSIRDVSYVQADFISLSRSEWLPLRQTPRSPRQPQERV